METIIRNLKADAAILKSDQVTSRLGLLLEKEKYFLMIERSIYKMM